LTLNELQNYFTQSAQSPQSIICWLSKLCVLCVKKRHGLLNQ